MGGMGVVGVMGGRGEMCGIDRGFSFFYNGRED